MRVAQVILQVPAFSSIFLVNCHPLRMVLVCIPRYTMQSTDRPQVFSPYSNTTPGPHQSEEHVPVLHKNSRNSHPSHTFPVLPLHYSMLPVSRVFSAVAVLAPAWHGSNFQYIEQWWNPRGTQQNKWPVQKNEVNKVLVNCFSKSLHPQTKWNRLLYGVRSGNDDPNVTYKHHFHQRPSSCSISHFLPKIYK